MVLYRMRVKGRNLDDVLSGYTFKMQIAGNNCLTVIPGDENYA
jgi:hypothetical protein